MKYNIKTVFVLPNVLLLQDNVDDGELKQQTPEMEYGEEQENADATLKDSSCLLLEEVELRDALTCIMR
jgi:hypothetical protein